jgi:peptide/nickel transport system permease protein
LKAIEASLNPDLRAAMTPASPSPALPVADPTSATAPERSPGYWQGVVKRLLRDRLAVAAGLIVLGLILMAVFAPLLTPVDPFAASMLKRLQPVGSPDYLLGSDELGRDMFSRLILGSRLSLFIGLTPVLLAFVIGSTIGIFAGYVGGLMNTLVMRSIDVLYAFPSVLLAIALSGALGAGIFNSLISLTIVFIPQIVRVAESVTTQVRRSDYVEAARASGAGSLTIVRVHVLGNVLGPIFVYTTSLISVSMILASGLSFLGLGVKPPEPEWGLMLNTLRTAIYSQPLVAALPGAMIFITSISFNLLSDGIRTAMEVKQ